MVTLTMARYGPLTLTEVTDDDPIIVCYLLTAVEDPLVRVTADAPMTRSPSTRARDAMVVVPPARTANVSGHGPWSPARDRTITLVKTLGRRRWKQASGPGGEYVLPIQVNHWRWPSRPESSWVGE